MDEFKKVYSEIISEQNIQNNIKTITLSNNDINILSETANQLFLILTNEAQMSVVEDVYTKFVSFMRRNDLIDLDEEYKY